MARRSVCLYNGNLLGIESIYTLSNGKQINIPKKTEEVRKLGREKKLFCPCGCGNNLTLVAGDRNNIKLTYPEDMERAENIINCKEAK
mgnify:CR=1 FL=1